MRKLYAGCDAVRVAIGGPVVNSEFDSEFDSELYPKCRSDELGT
jgi:hypothetical protein